MLQAIILAALFLGMAAGAVIAAAGLYEAALSASSDCPRASAVVWRLIAGLFGILLFTGSAAAFAPAILG